MNKQLLAAIALAALTAGLAGCDKAPQASAPAPKSAESTLPPTPAASAPAAAALAAEPPAKAVDAYGMAIPAADAKNDDTAKPADAKK